MTPEQELEAFANNQTKMERWRNAVNELREIGFDRVLRRMGEPQDRSVADPNHFAVAANEQMQRVGWYQALRTVFDFDEVADTQRPQTEPPDFGAEDYYPLRPPPRK